MADPFSSLRRRTSAMTYGRRAQAVRRASAPGSAFGSGSSKPPSSDTPQPLDMSDSSSGEDGSDSLADSETKGAWTRRTAHSALSKLEQLYEKTKIQDSAVSRNLTDGPGEAASSKSILDQTKNRWDLGEGVVEPKQERAATDSETADQQQKQQKQQRIVLDNTDMMVSAEEAAKVKARSKTRSRVRSQSAKLPPSSKVTKAVPVELKRARSRNQPETRLIPSDSSKNPRRRVRTKLEIGTGMAGPAARALRTQSAAPSQSRSHSGKSEKRSIPLSASQPVDIPDDPWGLGDLHDSSPSLPKRTSKSSRSTHRPRSGRSHIQRQIPTSSPPPPPLAAESQRDDCGKGDRAAIIDNGSASDSSTRERNQTHESVGGSTPKTQIGRQQILEKEQGPSSTSLKRLQSRAYSQNVMFTYGRSRNGDDSDDDGLSEFRRAAGSSRSLNISARLLLDHGRSDSSSSGIGATKRTRDQPVGPCSSLGSDSTRPAGSEGFRRAIGGVLQGIGSAGAARDLACGDLAARLGQQEFRDELLGSPHWLAVLLRALQREQDSPIVPVLIIVIVRAAFANAEVMQALVFDRQALEAVAGVLKSTAQTDILAMRLPLDFASDEQRQCVADICQTVRVLGLVDSSMAVSTYSLAVTALRSFIRDDDVAFLTMAGLLRGEVRESGCLALVVERLFTRSIPALVEQINSQPAISPFDDSFVSKMSARNAAVAAAAVARNSDDMWMGFDLPDESQNPAGLRGSTGHQQQSGKSSLPNELDPQIPSRLAIAMELEVIKFSATASRENQDEILSEKAVVPALLSLLGACQRASVGLRGQALERALETAVLVLQVLVNLSHGSTEFCSQFIRLRGLEAVARSVVFVSHSMAGGTAAAAAAAPKDVGDLCYDTLLIASALLTNIVDADSSAATHFGFVFQNPHCLLAAQCYPECVCANRSSLVALLARAFAVCHAMAGTADSSHSDAAVAAGYLAVLLGFLMRDNPGGHRAILQYLPQKSVAPVVARIGAFVRLSDSVASRFGKLLGGLGTAAFGLSEVGSGAQNPLLAPPSTESPPLPLSVTRSLADTAGGLRASANSGESPVAASLQSVIAALQSIQ